jgi:hypothetical protein
VPHTLARAFPPGLHESLSVALDGLPRAAHSPTGSITASNSREWPGITVHAEPLEIPYRIYNDVPAIDPGRQGSGVQVAIDCLYTRHHDGFVRQAALRRVLAAEYAWTIPYVVQLLGEYVVEICEDIERFAESELPARPVLASEVRSFADENPEFIGLTQQRSISYWECYQRGPHLYRDTYPGIRALRLMLDEPSD